MRVAASISRKILDLGRPSLGRRLQPAFLRSFELLLFVLPLAALLLRLELGSGVPVLASFLALIALALLVAAAIAGARALRGAGDPIAAARELDRLGARDELFVTAAELEPRRPGSPFFPALIGRAERALAALAGARPRPAFRLPALRRDLLLLLVTLLVLLVPALPRGLLGPRSAGGGEEGAGPAGASAGAAGRQDAGALEAAGGDGIAGRLQLRAETDRALYFLGEEIEFRVEVEALESLTPPPVELVLIVDGEIEMALPLPDDFVLPAEKGATVAASWPMRARLQLVDRYRRGLLMIDARLRPTGGGDPEDEVLGNRVLVQIAENSERVQARRPTPLAKPPEKPKPRREDKQDRDQEQRPNERQEPEKKPRPVPQGGEGEQIPEELETKDWVVEPLFGSDETTKRKVDVFDREIEDAPPQPEAPRAPEPRRRRYERMAEAEFDRLALGGRERRAVRRYLDALRPAAEKKDG